MTLPKMKLPGMAHHCIFRFMGGRNWSPPNEEVAQAFLFILAQACLKFDMSVSAWSLMGTHGHVVAHDNDPNRAFSRVCEFQGFIDSVFARWLQDYWGFYDVPVCDPQVRPQQIAIADMATEISTIQYVENNPVAARITADTSELNGCTSRREFLLKPLTIERPARWFSARRWPSELQLQLAVPPRASRQGFERLGWFGITAVAVQALTATWVHKHTFGPNAPGFLPMEWVLSRTPFEVGKPMRSSKEIPFTGADRRLLARLFAQLRGFRRFYKRQKQRVQDGEKNVVFPYGTVAMVSRFGFDALPPP